EPARARKFRVLQQLERETKEFLRPALLEAGYSGKESPERISDGEALGAALAKAPWQDLMRGFQHELRRFVDEFERAERLAPAGEGSLVGPVAAHEEAPLGVGGR